MNKKYHRVSRHISKTSRQARVTAQIATLGISILHPNKIDNTNTSKPPRLVRMSSKKDTYLTRKLLRLRDGGYIIAKVRVSSGTVISRKYIGGKKMPKPAVDLDPSIEFVDLDPQTDAWNRLNIINKFQRNSSGINRDLFELEIYEQFNSLSLDNQDKELKRLRAIAFGL